MTTAGPDGDRLVNATWVQRLNTSGGVAPAGTCTPGDTIAVPYSTTTSSGRRLGQGGRVLRVNRAGRGGRRRPGRAPYSCSALSGGAVGAVEREPGGLVAARVVDPVRLPAAGAGAAHPRAHRARQHMDLVGCAAVASTLGSCASPRAWRPHSNGQADNPDRWRASATGVPPHAQRRSTPLSRSTRCTR